MKSSYLENFKKKIGTILIGTVPRVDSKENTYIEIGELKGILSQRNRIKGERFRMGDTLKALLDM